MTGFSEKLSIRHLPAVRELAARSFRRLWSPQDFAYFLTHEHGIALGIFGDPPDRPLRAYFLALLVQGELDIVSVATDPESRRQGLGETLLRTACQIPGVTRAFLEVDVDNLTAIALYEKVGFLKIGRRKGYYDNRQDALVMRWDKA